MSILDDLEKITDFSETWESKDDLRDSLDICKECGLKHADYTLCFYRKRLNNAGVKIMFVSQNPNINIYEVNMSGSPTKTVSGWGRKRKGGIADFFRDFLDHNNIWSQFEEYLRDTKNNSIPSFYWTHIVKCFGENNQSKISEAFENCKEYLRKEIEEIQPHLIIAAGLKAGRAVYEIKKLPLPPMEEDFNFNYVFSQNRSALNQQGGVIVIPHPSGRGRHYDKWKQGEFPIGITKEDLKNLIDKLI